MKIQELLQETLDKDEPSLNTIRGNLCPQRWGSLISISSEKYDITTKECNGIVFDYRDDLRIVSYPLDKIQQSCDNIDWDSAMISPKLEGEQMTLFYYDNKWRVSCKGNPYGRIWNRVANNYIDDLFWDIWKAVKNKYPVGYSKYCFTFMMSLSQIRLISIRSLEEPYGEVPLEDLGFNWFILTSRPVKSIEEAKELIETDSSEHFIVDKNFNRISSNYIISKDNGG